MEGLGWRCRSLRFQLDGQLWMVNGEWWMVNCRRCWSFDQQPKFAVSLPVAKIILFDRFACWSKDQHGLKLWMANGEWWMVNGESSTILLFLYFYDNSSSTISVISFQLSIHPFHPAPFQLSVFNYPFHNWPFTIHPFHPAPFQLSVFNYHFSFFG